MTALVGAAQMAEFKAALRHVSDDIGDLMLSELEDIARGVAQDASRLVPRRSGAAAASYRPQGPAVTFGGPQAPYVPWLEFGGKVGRSKSVSRPYVKRGRYLYPVIARDLADIEKRVDALIEQASNGWLEVD